LILDEAHEYRGTFGTNVALIMRRLLLLCKRYGSQPQLIATSATMSEPAEHLRRLTGLTVTSIGPEHDGSGQGAKHFWMIKPARHSFEFARALVRDLIDANQSVIAFCLFRNAAEQLATDPWSEDPRIAVYKSGLLAQRRAAIEDGLKNGSIRAVYTTNALELGIDIGALDVCVCIGIPNTMMSVWQRAGRVGRGGRDGAVVLIADERPIDAYYCEHPAAFLDRNNEPLAVNMTSRSLAIWHYACALKEGNRNLDLLTPESLPEPLDRIALEHREGLTDQSFYTDDVHRHYNVRAGSDQTYKLMYDDAEIGEINRSQILREAPPNAIYFHDRKRYRVQSVHDSTRHVRLRLEHGRNRTTSFVLVTVRVQQVWRGGDTPNISAHAGRLLVSETLMNLVEKGHDGTVTRQFSGSQGLSANITPTTGVVVTIRNAPLLMARVAYTTSDATKHAWPGVVPLVRGLMPTLLGPCDLGDFGLHSVWNDDEGKLFVFDKAYDGIDLTLPIIDRISDLFKSALDRVNSCDCNETAGCLRCVLDAETKAPTDRVATRDLLKAIVRTLEAEPLTITTLESAPDRLAPVVFSVPCPQCGKKQAIDARFCNNCGQRLEQSA